VKCFSSCGELVQVFILLRQLAAVSLAREVTQGCIPYRAGGSTDQSGTVVRRARGRNAEALNEDVGKVK